MTGKVIGNPADRTDPWALANGPDYRPEYFYIKSQDKHGHSNLVHVKVTTTVIGEIKKLIAKELLPYRSVADFIRDAIIHRAKYIADNYDAGNLEQIVLGEALMSRMQMRKAEMEHRTEVVEQLRSHLASLQADSQWLEMCEVMDEAIELADLWSGSRHASEIDQIVAQYAFVRDRVIPGAASSASSTSN